MKYPFINVWYDHEVFGNVRVLQISQKKDYIIVENFWKEKRICCGWDGEEKQMLSRFKDL